ncbi:MAG: YkgJ family cysteine cluster protein [Desulfuromonadales bacterium]|jgi:Fe-S-cluster containining protein|nr:YkgJ family cysteine cluster protein [Desulfuromonadales bacterium]
MQNDFDFSVYSKCFQSTAVSVLGGVRTPVEIAGGTHLLVAAVEHDLLRFGDRAVLDCMACRPGCSSCCILNVSVLFPEAIALCRFLWSRLSYEALLSVRDRIEELYIRTRWLDDDERAAIHEPCAFLDEDGRCLIHPARPLLCRSVTSLDPSLCKEVLAAPPFSEAGTVPMNLFQKGLMEAAYHGFSSALKQLGLDDRAWRLTSAVHRLLSVPGATGEFLAGKQVARN